MTWLSAFFLAGIAAIISRKMHLVTDGGAALFFCFGSLSFGLGFLSFSVPILIFFVSSNLVSRIGKSRKAMLSNFQEKSSCRDAWQVFANGFIPTVLVIAWYLFRDPTIIYLYLSALAIATADTWATEIGVLAKSHPVMIFSFKKVAAGTSGGMTSLGTAAAFGGAALIAVSGFLSFPLTSGFGTILQSFLFILIVGVTGQVIDSILGAVLQAKYRCERCGHIAERKHHCGVGTAVLVSGIKWFNNDVVNIAAIGSGTLFGWIGLKFFIN